MNSKIFICIVIGLLYLSCSNNIYVKREKIHTDDLNVINYLGRNRTGEITLIDNKLFKAEKISIMNDSIIVEQSQIKRCKTLHLSQIQEISFTDHFVGFMYGLIGGFSLGTGIGFLFYEDSGDIPGLAILGYAAGFGLVGTISGAIIGIDRRYIFINGQ